MKQPLLIILATLFLLGSVLQAPAAQETSSGDTATVEADSSSEGTTDSAGAGQYEIEEEEEEEPDCE